jgi:EamA-like transporter family
MRAQDWLLLILLSTSWGTTFLFVAVANPDVPPLTLVLGRIGIAALVLVPVVWALRYRLPGSVVEWWPFLSLSQAATPGWSRPTGDEIARQLRDLAPVPPGDVADGPAAGDPGAPTPMILAFGILARSG